MRERHTFKDLTLHNLEREYTNIDKEHGAEKGKMVYDREEILKETFFVVRNFKIVPKNNITNKLKNIDKQYKRMIHKMGG